MHYLKRMHTTNERPVTYRMIMLGGVARMSRPSRTVYPLPAVRCDLKANRYAHVRDVEATQVKVRGEGEILPKIHYKLTFP